MSNPNRPALSSSDAAEYATHVARLQEIVAHLEKNLNPLFVQRRAATLDGINYYLSFNSTYAAGCAFYDEIILPNEILIQTLGAGLLEEEDFEITKEYFRQWEKEIMAGAR